MKKLNTDKLKKIKAGSISGAFLSGIGDIIGSIGDAISNVISTITGSVYMFLDMKNHHVKADYKFGDNEISYDDSKIIDLEKDKVEHQQTHDDVVDLSGSKVITEHTASLAIDHQVDSNYHEIYDVY